MRRGVCLVWVCLCLFGLGCKDGGGRQDGDGGSGGRAGVDGGNGGDSGAGGLAGSGGVGGFAGAGGVGGTVGTECSPGMTRDCYEGPPGTAGVGACMSGLETCNAEGTAWGPCVGQVIPSSEVPTPPGGTPADEDCDGMTDEV